MRMLTLSYLISVTFLCLFPCSLLVVSRGQLYSDEYNDIQPRNKCFVCFVYIASPAHYSACYSFADVFCRLFAVRNHLVCCPMASDVCARLVITFCILIVVIAHHQYGLSDYIPFIFMRSRQERQHTCLRTSIARYDVDASLLGPFGNNHHQMSVVVRELFSKLATRVLFSFANVSFGIL